MSNGAVHPAEGELIGPFRIVRPLGGGGMGVVHEAHDERLDRRVALKLIAPHLAEDPAFRERFTREARALAALDSAHVVHVYAHGEAEGRLYLATQLVPDGDLDQMLEEYGAPPVRVALDLMAQVASGLADAHAAGLVHRDIKPANVLLRRRESSVHAYLSDFGIARHVGAEDTRASRAGAVGTPAYMAPELHTGGSAGVATDVYSLGCLLWTTLTGRPPYDGSSDYQVAAAHLEAPVPQLDGDSAQVAEVNRILRTTMAKDPAERCASAALLRDDLRRAASLTGGTEARPEDAPAPARRRWALGAAVAALLLVAGGVVVAVTMTGDEEDAADPLAVATASLAEALAGQGGLSDAQARCTAERWIAAAGFQTMVEAGFFDEHYTYVDQVRAAMTPEIEEAARDAARQCADRPTG